MYSTKKPSPNSPIGFPPNKHIEKNSQKLLIIAHPNRTPLKFSLSRLFAQEKNDRRAKANPQALRSGWKASADPGKKGTIFSGKTRISCSTKQYESVLIFLTKIRHLSSYTSAFQCGYFLWWSFKIIPSQKKKKTVQTQKKQRNCSSPSAARPRSLGCFQRENAPHGWWAYVISRGVPLVFPGDSISLDWSTKASPRKKLEVVGWKCWKLEEQQYFFWRWKNDWVKWVNTPPSMASARFAAARIAPRWHETSETHAMPI